MYNIFVNLAGFFCILFGSVEVILRPPQILWDQRKRSIHVLDPTGRKPLIIGFNNILNLIVLYYIRTKLGCL